MSSCLQKKHIIANVMMRMLLKFLQEHFGVMLINVEMVVPGVGIDKDSTCEVSSEFILRLLIPFSTILFLQRQRIEEQKRKKRMTPGMVQANDERPRSGHRRRNDDATRPLMSGGKPQQQMHQHGTYGTFVHFFNCPLHIYVYRV